jgi:prolipoprotein diacylglyceryltransferase
MTHALNIVWNPSEGIDLGFFIIRYYSLMFVIAFGLGWYIMKHIFEREGESLEKLDSLFIWTVLATLIGARLGHVFFMIGNIIAITYLKLFYRFVLLQILNLQDIKGWQVMGCYFYYCCHVFYSKTFLDDHNYGF